MVRSPVKYTYYRWERGNTRTERIFDKTGIIAYKRITDIADKNYKTLPWRKIKYKYDEGRDVRTLASFLLNHAEYIKEREDFDSLDELWMIML